MGKFNNADEVPQKQRIKPTKLPMTTGKLEVTIKINELPTDVQTNKDNWKIFQLDCDGRVVSVTVKPKIWKKPGGVTTPPKSQTGQRFDSPVLKKDRSS